MEVYQSYLDDEDEVFVDESISLVIRTSPRCFSNIRAQAVFEVFFFSKYGAIGHEKESRNQRS